MIDYSSDFTYKVNKNNTVCITNYTGNSEKVEIPCEIDGMSVEEIGFMSFEQCTGIKEVTVPDTVAYIDDDAFAGCSQLTVINIPKNVNYIGSCVFDDCTNLKNITVDTDNKCFSSFDGVLYNKDKTDLIFCPQGKTEVIIPQTVLCINPYAFCKCSGLKEIEIPRSVIYIGKYAFCNCISLKEVYFPNVKNIDCLAFLDCTGLEKITIGNSVKSIGDNAFEGCKNLKEVTIPETADNIGICSFGYDNIQTENFTIRCKNNSAGDK